MSGSLRTRKLTTGCSFLGESSHHIMTPSETTEMIESLRIVASLNQSFCCPSSNTY